ncbi:MAG TPA: hypothetical protein VHY35_16485 [Stellaceae bacterium]|nr:hypothetical protein [Stellaceae bacterium]
MTASIAAPAATQSPMSPAAVPEPPKPSVEIATSVEVANSPPPSPPVLVADAPQHVAPEAIEDRASPVPPSEPSLSVSESAPVTVATPAAAHIDAPGPDTSIAAAPPRRVEGVMTPQPATAASTTEHTLPEPMPEPGEIGRSAPIVETASMAGDADVHAPIAETRNVATVAALRSEPTLQPVESAAATPVEPAVVSALPPTEPLDDAANEAPVADAPAAPGSEPTPIATVAAEPPPPKPRSELPVAPPIKPAPQRAGPRPTAKIWRPPSWLTTPVLAIMVPHSFFARGRATGRPLPPIPESVSPEADLATFGFDEIEPELVALATAPHRGTTSLRIPSPVLPSRVAVIAQPLPTTPDSLPETTSPPHEATRETIDDLPPAAEASAMPGAVPVDADVTLIDFEEVADADANESPDADDPPEPAPLNDAAAAAPAAMAPYNEPTESRRDRPWAQQLRAQRPLDTSQSAPNPSISGRQGITDRGVSAAGSDSMVPLVEPESGIEGVDGETAAATGPDHASVNPAAPLNRRLYRRVELTAEFTIDSIPATLVDLSVDGFAVTNGPALVPDQIVAVVLRLSLDDADLGTLLRARMIYGDGDRSAGRFIDLNARQSAFLRYIIASRVSGGGPGAVPVPDIGGLPEPQDHQPVGDRLRHRSTDWDRVLTPEGNSPSRLSQWVERLLSRFRRNDPNQPETGQ